MTADQNYHLPDDRHYDRESHMWVRLNSGGDSAIVGIDTLGLAALGDLAYLSLHAVGVPVKRGESIGTLEAAKMTGDIIAPISGILIQQNEEVARDPALVNQDPYDEGWLVKIEPGNWGEETLALVSGAELPAWTEAEIERYRAEGWID